MEGFGGFSGEDLLLGLYKMQKEAEKAPWALKEHDLPKGYWRRVINPDEGAEMVVLEHGKHFHVISLETFEVVKKVTLPRTFMATDGYCTYSDDGKTLTVPINKYDYDKRKYVYCRCEYETKDYTLLSQTEISRKEADFWTDSKT